VSYTSSTVCCHLPTSLYNSSYSHAVNSALSPQVYLCICAYVTSCAIICPRPCQLTFDLESGVRVTCDVCYLCANFSLPRPVCSRLRPDERDRKTDVRRQKDVRRASSLNASALWGRGRDIIMVLWHRPNAVIAFSSKSDNTEVRTH